MTKESSTPFMHLPSITIRSFFLYKSNFNTHAAIYIIALHKSRFCTLNTCILILTCITHLVENSPDYSNYNTLISVSIMVYTFFLFLKYNPCHRSSSTTYLTLSKLQISLKILTLRISSCLCVPSIVFTPRAST